MRMNSSTKHVHIRSVVSSSEGKTRPLSSSGSSGSNSSLGMAILHEGRGVSFKTLRGGPAADKVTGQVLLHRFTFGIGRHAVGAWFPRSAGAETAVLGLGHADQAFFGNGVNGVIVGFTAEDESHRRFSFM